MFVLDAEKQLEMPPNNIGSIAKQPEKIRNANIDPDSPSPYLQMCAGDMYQLERQ